VSDLLFYITLWCSVTLAVGLTLARKRTPTVGLTVAYLSNLSLNHFFGAVIYLLPWYESSAANQLLLGFRESVWGLVGFAVGSLALSPVLLAATRSLWSRLRAYQPDRRLPRTYILAGLVAYFIVAPLAGAIPSMGALVASGWTLVIVAVCLATWQAWQSRRRKLLRWIFASLGFPIVTVLGQGFLGYGIAALIIVFCFVASFYRPRWKVAIGTLLVIYMGLSLFVTYFRDRDEIRELVWSGEASLAKRMASTTRIFTQFEFLDLQNTEHLGRIDGRLNQNLLVGEAVAYVEGGNIEFAKGETIWQALVSIIPRILWPGKPVTAGSGDYVSLYTGRVFSEGTSVGMGQVFEFYINYGRYCVVFGFFLLGGIITFIDVIAGHALIKNNWKTCVYWFLPGVAFLQAGGSLVEVTSTFMASLAFCWLVNKHLLPHMTGKRIPWGRLFGKRRPGGTV